MKNIDYICCDCFKNVDIKHYIKNRNKKGKCSLCGNDNYVINSSNPNLIEMMRGLIRYYYPEYSYNGHCGGTDFPEELLISENPIIKHPNIIWNNVTNENKENFRFIMQDTIGRKGDDNYSYPLYKPKIYDRRYDIYYTSISEDKTQWDEILNEMQNINYSDLLNKYVNWANKNIFAHNTMTLNKSSDKWFRARIGYEEKTFKNEFNHKYTIKKHWTPKNLKAPPCMKATSGRCNREGISYLYLASDANTAISEVRPEPGNYVSVGEFKIIETIKVVNLCYTHLNTLSKSINGLNEYNLFQKIKAEFETPLTRDISNKYLKSQFITDLIKLNNYDGLIFNSSVANGKNLVLFDPQKSNILNKKIQLYKIQKQRFDYGIVANERDGWRESYSEVIHNDMDIK